GGGNNSGYGGGNNGGYGGGGYGGGNNETNTSYTNKPSGAEGWEDRSYGSSSENSEYESGRIRRKRGISNEGNVSNEES
ncbi:RNA-binding protein, partial [Prochlorococcus marinus str. MU1411]|nr:RNA-binding protein [Prochlorococcus marinus str. MU1411]